MFNLDDILNRVNLPSPNYMYSAIPNSWKYAHLPFTPEGLNLADLAKFGMMKTAMRTRQMPWDIGALETSALSSALGNIATSNLREAQTQAIPIKSDYTRALTQQVITNVKNSQLSPDLVSKYFEWLTNSGLLGLNYSSISTQPLNGQSAIPYLFNNYVNLGGY